MTASIKTSAELRQAFLDFFSEQGHEVVPSSSLIPGNDPTLLFTNAGMVQFKDVFLGQDKRNYVRATSSQRCVRAGGKHNDLENVGYTARHHTFFEMLGNFSFGDYFKRDAINYAWTFLTEVLQLPKEKLWVTVYESDDEAADIWLKEIGINENCLTRIGDKKGGKKNESDNFWSMGDTGPCGPCTEIFYDHGADIAGGPPGTPEEDGDRYIEIWNLVFMQYDRDKEGNLNPLPKPSVDTGMGLERLAAIMQDGHSNYDIDLFQNLITAVAKETNCKDKENNSLKVIADHIRSCSFLIVDGVLPSNEGRGYVLRRIIRRALRHGNNLGQKNAFFYKLVKPLVKEMGAAYPELKNAQAKVEKALHQEEERFAETLEKGLAILEQAINEMKGKVIPGEVVFKLYDTYGFPADLTNDIARERNLTLDMDGFEKAMEEQRERARAASTFGGHYEGTLDIEGETDFTGYEHLEGQSKIEAIYVDGKEVNQIEKNQTAMLVLDQTPFYAESGGQIGDSGLLTCGKTEFEVIDTQKQGAAVFGHYGEVLHGSLKVGDTVSTQVNTERRQAIIANHSATHLLHAALRTVLGEHVTQKGSQVQAERLRFDFSQPEPITPEQLKEIEYLVNQQIRLNHLVDTNIMTPDEAKASGAMALFGEKYGDSVRVLSMSDFSVELCGGVHVSHTGDIGLFKIISESGVAAGVRRIEAVTAEHALDWADKGERQLADIAAMLKGNRDDVSSRVRQLMDKNRSLEKELAQLKGKLASSQGSDLSSQAVDVNGIKVLAANLEGADVKTLRDTLDQLKNKLGTSAIVLAAVNGKKVSLVAGVSKDATNKVKAGDLVNSVASQVGGKGGGRPDMAQAGGDQPENLSAALKSVVDWVQSQTA
ncbi:MAG: alanine--tRNA ligase [Gammaproteobacteria bacterium]|nr:alanine--tRNA ligase [Gammaproteobacteria bacterium]